MPDPDTPSQAPTEGSPKRPTEHTPPSFQWKARARSFRFAGQGIAHAFRVTHNFRIHAAISLAVIGLAIWLRVGFLEWALLIGCTGLVSALEVLNTAIEALVDLVHPERDPVAGRIKDLAAGAVLVGAVAAALVGLLVLGPPLWTKLFG
jgi:diacylglycerol kinase